MPFEWNEAKRRANLAKHGLDFAEVSEFGWDDPVTIIDDRKDYGETRMIALDMYGGSLHCVVFTIRPNAIQIISFRRANRKEMKRYEKEKTQSR